MSLALSGCGDSTPPAAKASKTSVAPFGGGSPEHPPATGPVETVAESEFEGRAWQLTAYESREGVCVDLHLGSGSSGGCGDGRSKALLAVNGFGFGADLPDYLQVDGVVSSRVASLEMKSGGEVENVDLHPSERFNEVFFVVFIPRDVGGELIARDANGEILDRHEVPPYDGSFP